MRSAEEFRDRQIENLREAFGRPAMWCGGGMCTDSYYYDILRDLCWIEEREIAFQRATYEFCQGALRVYGQFLGQVLLPIDEFRNEVTSVYAEMACRLGYFTPRRLLTQGEYAVLRQTLNDEFFERDHTEAQIVARFGTASHVVGGGLTTVHCYGCVDRTLRWIFVDVARCDPRTDHRSIQWFQDPIVRDVRRNENQFELLPFARRCLRSDEPDGEESDGDDD